MLLLTFPSQAFKTNECYNDIKESVLNDETLKFKEITFSKFVLESGWFRSYKFRNYNNFTGMKYNSRKFVNGKSKDGYAKYSSWENCLEDYKLWQLKHLKNVDSEAEYLKVLSKIYCKQNPKYISDILKIRRKIFGSV